MFSGTSQRKHNKIMQDSAEYMEDSAEIKDNKFQLRYLATTENGQKWVCQWKILCLRVILQERKKILTMYNLFRFVQIFSVG